MYTQIFYSVVMVLWRIAIQVHVLDMDNPKNNRWTIEVFDMKDKLRPVPYAEYLPHEEAIEAQIEAHLTDLDPSEQRFEGSREPGAFARRRLSWITPPGDSEIGGISNEISIFEQLAEEPSGPALLERLRAA